MITTLAWSIVCCLPLQAGADGTAAERAATRASAQADLEGIWPSRRLIEQIAARWADEAAAQHDFDPAQRDELIKKVQARWPKFLTEHRPQIQPVLNDYIEMRLSLEPPDPKRVKEWSRRAKPVFELFRGQLDEGVEEFRSILSPLQKAKFEKERLQFAAGMQFFEAKLDKWADGEFEEHEFWEPPASERRKRRAARRREAEAREAAEGKAPVPDRQPEDQIAKELDAWEEYVNEFAHRYEFDDGQRGTARSVLNELRERASAHRDRNLERINELERRIAATDGSDEDLATIKEQLNELYGPIDKMFEELQRRVEGLLTSSQRARAESKAKNKGKNGEG